MKCYRYRAFSRSGIQKGYLYASRKKDVPARLLRRGLDCISCGFSWKRSFFSQPSSGAFLSFCLYLEYYTKSRIPFLEALQDIATYFKGAFRVVLDDIVHDLNGGDTFSQAISRYPHTFDIVFVSLVEVAEKTGDFYTSFATLTSYADQSLKEKEQIKKVSRYLLMIVPVVLGSFLMGLFYLMPLFLDFLHDASYKPSLATTSLVMVSQALSNPLWGVGIVSAGLICFFYRSIFAPFPKMILCIDSLFLRIPVVGPFRVKQALARVFYVLSITLESLDVIKSLEVAKTSIGFGRLHHDLSQAIQSITLGKSLSFSLGQSPFVGGPCFFLIQAGEETGNLPSAFFKSSALYQRQCHQTMEKISLLLEPLALLFLGGLLVWMITGLLFPLYESFSFDDAIFS